jgi:predicted  nucleic acid-binding Zn-ribbon protein
VSLDDFTALENRIRKAVELVKNERQARALAEERATQAEARAANAESQLQAQAPIVEQQQQELSALRSERDQVRQRVEGLLSQLDTLEL